MYLQSLAIAADAVVGDRMYVSMQAARVEILALVEMIQNEN